MQTEKKNNKAGATVLLFMPSQKEVAGTVKTTNAEVLEKLLDSALPDDYSTLMTDMMESYLTSDFYSCAGQDVRSSNYGVLQAMVKFFQTLKPSGAE